MCICYVASVCVGGLRNPSRNLWKNFQLSEGLSNINFQRAQISEQEDLLKKDLLRVQVFGQLAEARKTGLKRRTASGKTARGLRSETRKEKREAQTVGSLFQVWFVHDIWSLSAKLYIESINTKKVLTYGNSHSSPPHGNFKTY